MILMKWHKHATTCALAALVLGAAHSAGAQGIEVKNQQFVIEPVLPFAPVPTATSPAVAVPVVEPAVLSARTFKALQSDINVRGVVNRWSREMNLQEVVWQIASEDIPVDREVPFDGDFEQALRGLMSTTSFTNQPARACIHSNGVVRVIARTRFCDQP